MTVYNPYFYVLPKDLVAQEPASPRDSSRLFVYDTKKDVITCDRFLHLRRYIPQSSYLVMNDTQVLPARVTLWKENGGKVITLLLLNELENGCIKAFFDRKALIGQRLFLDDKHYFIVQSQHDKYFLLRSRIDISELLKIINREGTMPIPLYLRHSKLSRTALSHKYQTVFAKTHRIKSLSLGSVAAPTASLHFTRRVLKQLDQNHIDRVFIQLHVGLGTFAPVAEENVRTGTLHNEYYEINRESVQEINTHRKKNDYCIAIGTTVVRTLESHFTLGDSWDRPMRPIVGKTDLFIKPPYKFKIVNGLVTNFHLPESSLMMLVDAFLQHKKSKRRILDLYRIAIEKRFRFYSFGDVMMII